MAINYIMNQSGFITAPKTEAIIPSGVVDSPFVCGAYIIIIMGYSKLRMVWMDMKRRCDNPNRIAYFEFIHWLLTETNYPLRFGEINKEETAKYYQYWINNLKK